MRSLGISVVLALVATVVVMAWQPAASPAVIPPASPALPQAAAGQTAIREMKTFASAADVQVLPMNAKAERTERQVLVAKRILSLAPYTSNLEYRPVIGAVAVHEKEAELVYVKDGGRTRTTGGKVVGEKRTNAKNLSGTAIDGGTAQTIAKGDFAIIPEGMPHQFSPHQWSTRVDDVSCAMVGWRRAMSALQTPMFILAQAVQY